MKTENDIRAIPFSEQAFIQAVVAASGDPRDATATQVKYLASYCASLGATMLVCETRYVDRHYLDEFATYYSRQTVAPPNVVQRIHVFGSAVGVDAFDALLVRSMESVESLDQVQSALAPYLGYCCVRPIPSVPIGRTVLSRLPEASGPQRQLWATSKHEVHIGNLSFSVEGLPFQQQDVAVGACATAAVWAALSRVLRHEGTRAPTPADIAEISRGGALNHRSPLPATSGMSLADVGQVIRSYGFAVDEVGGHEAPELLALALHTYLLSGIPVVLALRGSGQGHAVTAVGFQSQSSEHPALMPCIPALSARLHKLYVHDDRVGPYARSHLEPFSHPDLGEGMTFEIEADGMTERSLVLGCVAPVYPKLRLRVRSLIEVADRQTAIVEEMVGPGQAFDLRVDMRYRRSGEYLAGLVGRVAPERGAALMRRVALSRWCGIVRWYLADTPMLEFVYDTTDVLRRDGWELLRAVVALDERVAQNVEVVARKFDVPFA